MNKVNIAQLAEDLLVSIPLERVLLLVLGIALIVLLMRALKMLARRRIRDYYLSSRVQQNIGLANNLLILVLVGVVFRSQFQQLGVLLGFISIGIALALKESIASLFGWMVLSVGDYFQIGDRIELNGVTGDVVSIGLTRITLMETGEHETGDLYTGKMVRIPNYFIFAGPVRNYSAQFEYLWDEVKLTFHPGSRRQAVRDLLQEAADEVLAPFVPDAIKQWDKIFSSYLLENARIQPFITKEVVDHGYRWTIRYVVPYDKRRSTKDRLITRILAKLDKRPDAGSLVFHASE